MAMTSNFHEDSVERILEAVLGDASGAVTIVNPSAGAVEDVVGVLDGLDDPPSVTLLADNSMLKDVLDDFLLASVAADLVADDRLALRTVRELPTAFLLVTEGNVVAVVRAGERVAGLVTDDDGFVERAREQYADMEAESAPFGLRTPPLSQVRGTITTELGEGVREDFEAILDSLETARGDGDGIDEVDITLLVAARNDVLLYDVSRWGEDISLASKATFSRTKTAFEEAGIIETEKVPIDVGRPRLRLVLAEEFEGRDPAELAAIVAERRATDGQL